MFKWLKREKRLEELEATTDKLVKDLRALNLEWDSTYEKFRLLYMRLSKRVQQLDRAPETETAQPAEGGEQSSLSERHRKIQEQILTRRNRGGNGGLLHG